MTESIVSASGLGKSIRRRSILHDISLSVAPATWSVCSAKTAPARPLLELLLGFSHPSTGRSALFGHDSLALPAAVKARIGFAPQQDELAVGAFGLRAVTQRRWRRIDWLTFRPQRTLSQALRPAT